MKKHSAEDYRAMARRVLEQAEETRDPQMKETLNEIATRYEWLAKWVERDQGGPPQ